MKLVKVIIILLSMTLRNIAHQLKNGTGRHHLSEEYENSAMELEDVKSVSNVIEIKKLKCGKKLTLLKGDLQFSNQTTPSDHLHHLHNHLPLPSTLQLSLSHPSQLMPTRI